ncbi:hypothetical protein KA068_02190 [Candidatus Saccharibacteria bacterium]|jgi:KaiC/GvpD/RAD55 family RecA-like ATPase|nr:hypothetical protein [Candidatus Saccharibacteria bacterium]
METVSIMSELNKLQVEPIVKDILSVIPKEREQEIIARRFGLFERRETLEQIGELLGITRERVRQLEKATLTSLRALAAKGELPHINEAQTTIVKLLVELGHVARIRELSLHLTEENTREDQSKVAFIAQLCPKIVMIDDNDHFHRSAGLLDVHDEVSLKSLVERIVSAIKAIGAPATIDVIAKEAKHDSNHHAAALASTSKHLATLNGKWGLIKWPTVNPKNIRDKIYVILQEGGKHMHFSEIADAIKNSDFKRRDVTTQAIHNELIKDKRFILIGRGIYALKEWGYKQGTVSDIIADILRTAEKPLHRDEIVKKVLESRYVKETTILLNLQSKSQFKRTAKATYTLAED